MRVFEDMLFSNSLQVTAFFTTISVLVELLLGIFLAVIVAGQRPVLQKLLVTGLVLDMMISPVSVALIWRFLAYPGFGVLDSFTAYFFGLHVPWLGDPYWARITIILVDIWHWTGFVFLIVFAGYLSLPLTVFEAAQIDGASGFQQFFRITLPLLKPTIAVVLLFRTVDVLQAFPEIWQLTFGGPVYATTILNILVYIATFDMRDYAYAAVVSLLLIMLSFGVTLAYTLFKRRMIV
jgi:multiple sugar transport system permease protein